jgi:hypothetical protein
MKKPTLLPVSGERIMFPTNQIFWKTKKNPQKYSETTAIFEIEIMEGIIRN